MSVPAGASTCSGLILREHGNVWRHMGRVRSPTLGVLHPVRPACRSRLAVVWLCGINMEREADLSNKKNRNALTDTKKAFNLYVNPIKHRIKVSVEENRTGKMKIE